MLTIDQLKMLDSSCIKGLAQTDIIKQTMIVQELLRRFDQKVLPEKIDGAYLTILSLELEMSSVKLAPLPPQDSDKQKSFQEQIESVYPKNRKKLKRNYDDEQQNERDEQPAYWKKFKQMN